MAQFVVEEYAVTGGATSLADVVARLLRAAAVLAEEGKDVQLERSVLLLGDRVALHFFEAENADDVSEMARRAAVVCDRVHEAHEARP